MGSWVNEKQVWGCDAQWGVGSSVLQEGRNSTAVQERKNSCVVQGNSEEEDGCVVREGVDGREKDGLQAGVHNSEE